MAISTSHRPALSKKFTPQNRSTDCSHTMVPVLLNPALFAFTLPIPPSINSQYATVKGRRVLSLAGRRYKTTISQILLETLLQSPDKVTFLHAVQSHYLSLSIHFYFPTLLRRDLDGGLKIAQDAVCEAMGINDNRIIEIHLYKSLDRETPRLNCTVSTIRPAPALSSRRNRAPRLSNRRIRS